MEGVRLCRNHFYEIGVRRLEEHKARLREGGPTGPDRSKILSFVSQLISETTVLVAGAKLLGQEQRDKYLDLSFAATELYKRVQRLPRISRNMPIVIYSEPDSTANRELTSTVDISKRGACVTTRTMRKTGEKTWIEKPGNQERALVRVAWAKKGESSEFVAGLEILDREDFWG